MSRGHSPSVFISHSRQDQELARDIARRARAVGLEPLDDLPVRPGEDFSRKIGEVIRKADAVIFLLTPAALESDWTAFEMGVADGADKPILPVLAGVGNGPLSPLLESYQAVPYDRLDEAVLELARRLAKESENEDDPRASEVSHP